MKEQDNAQAFLWSHKISIVFMAFLAILSFEYYSYISAINVPIWDGAVYLTNARDWLTNTQLSEPFRPPLISWIIGAIWFFSGENLTAIKPLQAIFTVGAGIIFYTTLKRDKNDLFALAVAVLLMVNAQVFFWSIQILTEGFSLFFLLLTLFFIKNKNQNHWYLAGISVGLTFASRYPIIIQALTITFTESIIQKHWKPFARTLITAIPTIIAVVAAMQLKTGAFQVGLAKDVSLSVFLTPFYLFNSFYIWGPVFLLVPLAIFSKRTYSDRHNYTFIMWFLVSILFWSAIPSNTQYRFVIQFTPAVYYLAVLGIEDIVRR